jgi:hypothetical protein
MNKTAKIIDLIKKDISIPKISKELNVAKSTIYYHYKKIKGRKYKKPSIPKDYGILGEFLGIFAGDGCYYFEKKTYHHRITIHLHAIDDKDYSIYIKKLLEKHFNKKCSTYIKDNNLTIKFYSKDILKLIKKYLNIFPKKSHNVFIKKDIDNLPNNFLSSFIRGLFDTDGHHKNDGRLMICLASKKMVFQAAQILKERFRINNTIYKRKTPKNHKTQYEMYIPKREYNNYKKLIGFSNKRKETMNARAGV